MHSFVLFFSSSNHICYKTESLHFFMQNLHNCYLFFLDYLIWFAHFELKCVIIFLKHSPALLTFPQQDVFLFQQLCFCLIDKCNTCTHSLTELHHCVETDWKRQILCECVSAKREVCKNSAVVSSPVIPTLFILFVKTYLKGLMRKFDSIS